MNEKDIMGVIVDKGFTLMYTDDGVRVFENGPHIISVGLGIISIFENVDSRLTAKVLGYEELSEIILLEELGVLS